MGRKTLSLMIALLLGLIICLFSCHDFLETWEVYEIREGQHYSHRTGMPRRLISLTNGRHMIFKARFTNTCLYDMPGNNDINKLYGFTDSNSFIHDNSIRFGWRHSGGDNIEIFAYWYNGGVRGIRKLGETKPYQEDMYELWAKDDIYYFRFNDIEYRATRTHKPEQGIRARLFPYFGGDLPASQDIRIFIYEYN